MTSQNIVGKKRNKEFDSLCVDDFIGDILSARALATAFETGLIDSLIQSKFASLQELTEPNGRVDRGMSLLIHLLVMNRVLENREGTLRLTEEFVRALSFRDLLELKISLANFAAHDLLDYFSDMVGRPDKFMGESRFCRLFSYDKCFDRSSENIKKTKRWMRITTMLTRYEAGACMKYHDFGRYRRMLDVGGNSGEFALRICKRFPEITATVFDLPLVCDIGMEHVRSEPEAGRISFFEGDATTDALPGGFDLVTFKSMLHDWPEAEAIQFILKAGQSLVPGGTLLIFERGPMENDRAASSYASIPMLLFFNSFRLPAFYQEQLDRMKFQNIALRELNLDTPFFLITAEKSD